MVDFITNRGGTIKFAMEFVILGDYLIKDVDISLLDNTINYLSTNALDFLKLWYTHNHMRHKRIHISPILIYGIW